MRDLPTALRTVVLAIDFDTEVTMQGILGFLENSTGLFLSETITAFEEIGASETARGLSDIRDFMIAEGISAESLRSEVNRLEPWQLTTFENSHPSVGEAAREQLVALGRKLRFDARAEGAMALLEQYVAAHLEELRIEVATWSPT